MLQISPKVLTVPYRERILSVAVIRYAEIVLFFFKKGQDEGVVQDMAVNENTYEQQFTKENIQEVSTAIKKAIETFTKEEYKYERMDLFLLIASLGQVAYEWSLKGLSPDEAHAKKSMDEGLVIGDKLIRLLDENRSDMKPTPTAELLSAAHVLSILSEFYARRRDEVIEKIRQE